MQKLRQTTTSREEKMRKAADEIGGELLEGSGFESEEPEGEEAAAELALVV